MVWTLQHSRIRRSFEIHASFAERMATLDLQTTLCFQTAPGVPNCKPRIEKVAEKFGLRFYLMDRFIDGWFG